MEDKQTSSPNQSEPNKAESHGLVNGYQDTPETLEAALEQLSEQRAQMDELRVAVEQAKQDALTHKDKFLRALAEAENLRRRTEKEKSDLLQYGLEKMISDLLPVLDSIETARGDMKNEDHLSIDSLKAGFDLVGKQLVDALNKHGLSAVNSDGAPFDPNLHQAIQRIESDTAEGETVKQSFVRGYLLNGRLIRPAMVSVEVPKGS